MEGRAPHGAERKPEGWSEHRAARWSRGAEKACGPDPLSQRVQEGGQGWGAVLGPVGAGREQTQRHRERQREKQAWGEDRRVGRRGVGGAGHPQWPGHSPVWFSPALRTSWAGGPEGESRPGG